MQSSKIKKPADLPPSYSATADRISPALHTNAVIEAGHFRARDEQEMQFLLQNVQQLSRIYNPEIEPEHDTDYYCNCHIHRYISRKINRLNVLEMWSRAVMYPGEKFYHDCYQVSWFTNNPYSTFVVSPYGFNGASLYGSQMPSARYHAVSIRQTISLNESLNAKAQAAVHAQEPSFNIWETKSLESSMSSMSISVHNRINTISDSSFFRENRPSTLPNPAEVRAINEGSGNIRGTSFNRPPPVKFPSLGLIVKYGADTSVTEAETQHMVYKQLKGKVPVPEGETLEQRWVALNDMERMAVCKELNGMVKAWRSLEKPDQVFYMGGLGNQPLNDIFLSGHRDLAGPFHGADTVQKFQNGCDIEIDGEVPVAFTHDDLVPPNILLSLGTNPVVAAIIDWGQAGWYPAYWEYCKARRVRPNPEYFDDDLDEEWNTRYLPTIVDPVDDETVYHPWLWFVLSKGI
ncbi:hypothetical protein N7513_002795 [Penicillium frequentans]|nr:hypothetical protein N7513_002795 [Penicillium glabrum]